MKYERVLLFAIAWMLAACVSPPIVTPTMTPVTPTSTPTPAGDVTPDPATATPTAEDASSQTYLDDRSDAYALMTSFVNALNRHEYLRAYSYWEPNAKQLAPFYQFEQGYANTGSVQLTLGQAREGVAAGNMYMSVPTAMVVQDNNGGIQVFVGCYELHLANPAIQGEPPFQPLAIRSAQVEQIASAAEINTRLAQACDPAVGSPISAPTADPTDISADRYLDERSTPETVMRSFANALNRHELVRAYAYWDANSPQLPPFTEVRGRVRRYGVGTNLVGRGERRCGRGAVLLPLARRVGRENHRRQYADLCGVLCLAPVESWCAGDAAFPAAGDSVRRCDASVQRCRCATTDGHGLRRAGDTELTFRAGQEQR